MLLTMTQKILKGTKGICAALIYNPSCMIDKSMVRMQMIAAHL